MKRTIIIAVLTLLLFSIQGYCQQSTLEYDWRTNQGYEKIKYECEFCGKNVFQYIKVEFNKWPGLIYVQDYNSMLAYDSTLIQQIEIKSYITCQKCFDKYNEAITKKMNNIIELIVEEKANVELRKLHAQKRKIDKINQLKKEIEKAESRKKELKEEMKNLKSGKIKKEEYIWLNYDSTFTIDTLLIIKERKNIQ